MHMKLKQKFTFLSIILIIIVACNMPGTTPTLSVDDQAATIIALTLQAETQNNEAVPVTATFSPVPQVTSTIGTTGPAATITPTYSVPMLTLREQTNCRTGPGQDYEVLFTYLKGAKVEIIGNYPQENYWLVKSTESPTGVCWLWGEYADVIGSYWAVASVTPPATATIAPPQAPSIQKWDFSCGLGTMTFTMSWTDRATNETGYRVYRDGELLAELPANSTSYTDSIALLSGESTEYYLQVYAPSGSANSSLMKMSC